MEQTPPDLDSPASILVENIKKVDAKSLKSKKFDAGQNFWNHQINIILSLKVMSCMLIIY